MMEFIFELLFQIIPGRVWVFLLAVLLIVGGIYVWRMGGQERARYDAATGSESKTYHAEIRYKSIRSVKTSGMNDHDTAAPMPIFCRWVITKTENITRSTCR